MSYPSELREDTRWISVTVKICELCGKTFLREGQQKECMSCTAILAKPPEPIPAMTQEESHGWAHYEKRYPKMSAAAKERERKRRLELWKKQTQQQAARKISERATIQ